MVYLPVDKDVQRVRITYRQATAPHQTFPMTGADIDSWREQFQYLMPPNWPAVRSPGHHQGGRAGRSGPADRWPSLADS